MLFCGQKTVGWLVRPPQEFGGCDVWERLYEANEINAKWRSSSIVHDWSVGQCGSKSL